MRILMLVLYPNNRSPLVKHTPLLIDALRSLGCDVVTEPWGRHRDHESLIEKVTGRIRDIIRIRRTVLHQHFDIMIIKTSHDWATLSRDIPLLYAIRRLCPHVVLQLHGSSPNRLVKSGSRLFKIASKLLLRGCDSVFVLSIEEQRDWRLFYPTGKFYVTKNPYISTESQILVVDRPIWATPNGKPVLLFVGRLIKEKGIFDLVKAMPLILEKTSCHLLVVGEGEEAPHVRELIKTLGLERNVILTGYLGSAHLLMAYKNANIFVLPTYWFEGFPTVILEALGAGLPIITTYIRGAADYLKEGVNSLFIPSQAPRALADAVIKLLSDPVLCKKLSQANREKVKEFAPEVVGKQFLNLIERVVNVRPKGN
jgi:glycosyltransferase involved in cell wall biosynthesis